MNSLGIDIGSTSIKSAMLDLDALGISEPFSTPFPSPRSGLPKGHFEIPISEIHEAVLSHVNYWLKSDPSISSLFISSQMGGVVVGEVYISWRDLRSTQTLSDGSSYLDQVKDRLGTELLKSIGNELRAGSTTTLLYALRLSDVLPCGANFTTLGSAISAQLTLSPPQVEHSEAIGVWDFASGDWNHQVFEALDLHSLVFPKVVTNRTPIGEATVGNSQLDVYAAVGDHPCSLLGVGVQDGELSINVSTGSQVSRLTRNVELGNWQTRFGLDDRYINTVTHLPAGRSLEAIVSLLESASSISRSEIWNRIALAVERGEDTELAVDLAFFDGPLGNHGSIDNITVDNLTLGELFRASFRNMAANYKKISQQLDSQESWNSIVLSGGLTQRFPYLKKQIASCFAQPIREVPEGEDALLGLLHHANLTLNPQKNSGFQRVEA